MNDRRGFAAFVLIGAFASLVNLVARILIDRFTSFEIAVVLAFPVALTTAFLLNRALVFRSAEAAWHGQFVRFLLVNLAALAQIFVISVALARYVFPFVGMRFHPETVAHAIGLLSPLFTNYWAHKHFTFRGARVAGEVRR